MRNHLTEITNAVYALQIALKYAGLEDGAVAIVLKDDRDGYVLSDALRASPGARSFFHQRLVEDDQNQPAFEIIEIMGVKFRRPAKVVATQFKGQRYV